MASIGKDRNGRRRILFVDSDGSRKTIRLGKVTAKQAAAFKVKLEALIGARLSTGSIDDETSRWVAGLPDDTHAKLAAVGLVTARAATMSLTLGQFLSEYRAGRCDVKASTQLVFGRTCKHLLDFFGPDKSLRDINEGDADSWRLYLVKQGLAENTIRRTCGIARQFFRAAFRRKLIANNPFTELKVSVQGNKAREYYLSRQDAQKVLDACPDSQWRLIFALARYGGLRTPSETLRLRWADVDWAAGRMLVHSPKTEHHDGGESRLVPIFPELYPHLLAAYTDAEPGTEYAVTRYRKPGLNLRTQLMRILAKAGLKPWPKLWQNLRSTRQTELAKDWPEYVVCAWMGNSKLVAREHYLQVTDEHFRQAAHGPEKCAQNPAQYTSVSGSNEHTPTPQEAPENADLQVGTTASKSLQEQGLGGRGLEPLTSCVSSTRSSQLS